MSSTRPDQPSPKLSQDELASLVSTLQLEMVGLKARVTESEVRNESLQETIVNFAHENELLKRRIYGNKTERLRTSEQQLTLGNLLDDEKQLQKELDAAVAKAHASDEAAAPPPPADEPKAKPKGRRDLATSDLPRFLLEIRDEELEKSAKLIGFDDTLHLMFRRGGFSVLVKRIAKYEVPGKDGPTVLGVETPKTLFRRGLLHSSVVAYILVQKFSLGVPHYRLEQHITDQGVQLDRSMMCRYVEEAGSTLGATIVHAMWQAALKEGCVISTDATSAMVQPEKSKDRQRQACKKGHFFTAVVDCDHVLFAYSEKHTQDFVKKLFGGFTGFLQSDASNVYDILDRGPPLDNDESIALVGCWGALSTLFLRGGGLQVSGRPARPDAHSRHLRGRRCIPQTTTRQTQAGSRSARASTDARFLSMGERRARQYAGAQPRDQGPRLRCQSRAGAAARTRRRSPAARQHALRTCAAKSRRRSQKLDVLWQRYSCRERGSHPLRDCIVQVASNRPPTVSRRGPACAAVLAAGSVP